MERNGGGGSAVAAAGRVAYYARLLPQHKAAAAADHVPEAEGEEEIDAVASALRRALVPEDIFYRVVKESKLYAIIFSGVADGDDGEGGDAVDRNGETVVVVQEITKHGARSSSRGRGGSIHDQNGTIRTFSVTLCVDVYIVFLCVNALLTCTNVYVLYSVQCEEDA